jgi:hypothetical protein
MIFINISHTEIPKKNFTLKGTYSGIKNDKTRVLVATVYGILYFLFASCLEIFCEPHFMSQKTHSFTSSSSSFPVFVLASLASSHRQSSDLTQFASGSSHKDHRQRQIMFDAHLS